MTSYHLGMAIDLGHIGAKGRNVYTWLHHVTEASYSMVLGSWREYPTKEHSKRPRWKLWGFLCLGL